MEDDELHGRLSDLVLRMADGREIAVQLCLCTTCDADWFVPYHTTADGQEFWPSFCCYCGAEFRGIRIRGIVEPGDGPESET